MRDNRTIVTDALSAWRILTDLPLPEALLRRSHGAAAARMLIWFPLWGVLCGAAIAAAGALLAAVSNRFAGAVLFAVLTGAFMLFKDSGRALMLMTSWLLDLIGGDGFAGALSKMSSDREVMERRFGAALAGALALGLLLMLFLTGLHGGKWVLIPLFAGAFATQGEFAAALDPAAGGIADPERSGRRLMWIVCAAAALALLPCCPTATAFGALAVCLINMPLREKVLRSLPAPDADTVTWAGGVTEISLLCCAFLWTIG